MATARYTNAGTSASRGTAMAGIITGTRAKAVKWRAEYGIPEKNIYDYETMHRIADNADIDVVYVVTPNALHLDNALVAAHAGKHVFCEKPMEISVERCRQMIDAVKAASLPFDQGIATSDRLFAATSRVAAIKNHPAPCHGHETPPSRET